MHVAVCVKQIPDPATPGELDPSTKTLKREGKLILDESDSYGVEMALQLVDAAGPGPDHDHVEDLAHSARPYPLPRDHISTEDPLTCQNPRLRWRPIAPRSP